MILNYAKLQALQIDTEVFYSGETLFKAMENKENATRTRVNAAGQGKEAAGKNGGRKNW